MRSLTEDELDAAIKEGKAARAEKARALATAVRGRGYITDDDIRQVALLRGQFTPFMNAVLTPIDVVPPAPKFRKPPLLLAALSACSLSAITTLITLTAAELGRLV